MPITEDNFTADELQAVLEKKPELKEVVTSTLGGVGYKVIESTKYDDFIKTEREAAQGSIRSEIYGALNKDIAEVAGFAKEGEEKTYDFAKRAISTYKTQAEQHAQKVAELEEKIKSGSGDEALKAELAAWKQKEAEWLKEKETTNQTLFEKEVGYLLAQGLVGFKAKPGIDQELIDLKLNTVKAELMKSAKKTEGGKVVFTDEKGEIIINKDTTEAADAAYILKERLKSIADEGKKQSGTGATGGSGNGGDASDKTLPVGLKTQHEVTKALIKIGILAGTPEFDKAVAEYPGYDKMPSGL